ncbi:MAG: nuclear transport factor 2 family protein [Labilithrix sp.]|nr:nuclear transport factor 2 family protein [Labilithrix sp.]MCW5812050.1 nuclear transport factor 2 family protein [Labilithrix sp.]
MSAAVIEAFYDAFSKRDAEGMVKHYADDVRFSDPVFQDLKGDDAKNMWRMLCERGKDLEVVASDVTENSAHWDATYTFALTRRKVLNRIDAKFTFEGDKIKTHTDAFDLYAWTRMAFGVTGVLLGWTGFFQSTLRKKALAGLVAFERENRHDRA